jgi:hypothetical protein
LPYGVATGSPVTAFAGDEPDADVFDEDDEDEDDAAAPGDGVVVAGAADAATCGLWAWKASVAATPAAVALRTMGARFMD